MIRTIQAPGIELREIDRSDYQKTDYSLVGTTSLVCGFADKGDNYSLKWINTIQNFVDTYGAPTNEDERYFYNAAHEILSKGGIFFGARLPYSNEALTSVAYASYSVDINPNRNTLSGDEKFSEIHDLDESLTSYIKITNSSSQNMTGYISMSEFDSYKTSASRIPLNTFRIVDITRSRYETVPISRTPPSYVNTIQEERECLGILPIIVTPANALFYQNMISHETSTVADIQKGTYVERTTGIDKYQTIKDLRTIYYKKKGQNYNLESFKRIEETSFSQQICSDSIYNNTLAKTAAGYFPTLAYINQSQLDRTYLKQIGVVVFKVYKDSSTNTSIGFQPVESFVGSLSRKDKNQITGTSIFIDDIINSNSQYINFFSNIQLGEKYDKSDIIAIDDQIGTILGIYNVMSDKTIKYDVSFLQALNTIFDLASDTNRYNFDLVLDAGVSNIAQRVQDNIQDNRDWTVPQGQISFQNSAWKTILQKYDNFCKNIRKDCMFIADGLRPFCLDGNQKIVRQTAFTNSVEKDIIPRLKSMPGLNSSYSAGYCNWFLINDAYTGEQMWCPPSIKAAGVYVYTDVYYNNWDAPAGINRGVVTQTIDCAFSPTQKDAERIYLQCWNYAVNYPLDGIVLEGQKTFQIKPTAFDRINVRRLFLYLEKQVSRIARRFVYEGNTEYQRQRFVDAITPLFERAVQRNGIAEYYIKCDDDNNTPQTIDNNELHCTIALKPIKTIEFIVLNFVCTNQSATVSEEVRGR